MISNNPLSEKVKLGKVDLLGLTGTITQQNSNKTSGQSEASKNYKNVSVTLSENLYAVYVANESKDKE